MQTPEIDLPNAPSDLPSPDPVKLAPIITQADDSVAKRYLAMGQLIVTKRGQDLMFYILRERLPVFRERLSQIDAAEQTIITCGEAWRNGLTRWQNALKKLAELYDEVGGSPAPLKGGRLKRMQSALNEAKSACDNCKRACPNNLLLTQRELDMEHWLCKWGLLTAPGYEPVSDSRIYA